MSESDQENIPQEETIEGDEVRWLVFGLVLFVSFLIFSLSSVLKCKSSWLSSFVLFHC